MRICFVASSYPKHAADGSARFIRSLAEGISDLGHTVHVLIPFRSDLRLEDNRVPLHTFRYAWPSALEVMGYAGAMDSDTRLRPVSYLLAPAFAAAEAAALLRLHRRHRFDVVHAHWVIPNGVVAAAVAALVQRPLVVSLHGSDIFVARGSAALGRVAAPAFRQAAAVTACSPELEQGALALDADPRRLRLIPWGADPAVFQQGAEMRQAARSALGLTPDQFAVLSLGRLVQKKGIAYLVQAMAAVAAAAPGSVCLVAGDGPELPALRAQAAALGLEERVRFLGSVPWVDAPKLLAACDVFAVPSIHDENGNVDGLPTTILEAMAAGRPVVATQVAGIELAVEHGVHGLLAPEKSPDALAHALLLLYTQPRLRQQLGANAGQRVRDELNWHNVARQFVAIYEQVLAGHAQP